MRPHYIDFMREYLDLSDRTFGFACAHLMELPPKHNLMFFSHALDIATNGSLLEESIEVAYVDGYSTYVMTSVVNRNISLGITLSKQPTAWIQFDGELAARFKTLNIPLNPDNAFESVMLRIANVFKTVLLSAQRSTSIASAHLNIK